MILNASNFSAVSLINNLSSRSFRFIRFFNNYFFFSSDSLFHSIKSTRSAIKMTKTRMNKFLKLECPLYIANSASLFYFSVDLLRTDIHHHDLSLYFSSSSHSQFHSRYIHFARSPWKLVLFVSISHHPLLPDRFSPSFSLFPFLSPSPPGIPLTVQFGYHQRRKQQRVRSNAGRRGREKRLGAIRCDNCL